MTINTSQLVEVPSGRRLFRTTATAVAVAVVLLFTTILPAEYGIDPLGTGRILGLTAISTPSVSNNSTPPSGETSLTPVQEGPIAHFGAEYKVDSTELVIDPYQYVEYKYRLEKGATMLYAWTATETPIYDFHADPDGSPQPPPVSFDKKPKREARGAFTAPFTGVHGWYWENPGGEKLTIRLTTAGFYSAATEFRSPRLHRPHDLTALARLVFPSQPHASLGTP